RSVVGRLAVKLRHRTFDRKHTREDPVLALRMRQKESEFYFVSYPAEDLLRKVHFVTRFYGERGETIGGDTNRKDPGDDVERFVQAIEGNAKSFQRELIRRKVRQIRDFYRNETRQPVIPGAV